MIPPIPVRRIIALPRETAAESPLPGLGRDADALPRHDPGFVAPKNENRLSGALMDFPTDLLQNRIVHAVLRFKGILGLLGRRELLILLRSPVESNAISDA